jgi:hypothetical protein
MRPGRDQSGQAAIEVLGALPVLLLLGLALCQLLAVGYAALLAANAAEAGALAVAGGADAAASARRALPGWTRAGASVRVRGGRVTVRVRPPSLVAAVARRLETASTASVVR